MCYDITKKFLPTFDAERTDYEKTFFRNNDVYTRDSVFMVKILEILGRSYNPRV
jgi:hypothetical protein